jgi:hypothetical protein
MNRRSRVEFNEQGRIIATMSLMPEAYEASLNHPRIIDGTADIRTQYVKDGKIVDRPVQETVLDGSTLRNLPAPCQIQINDDVYDCNDDHAELGFDLPITYRVTVCAWPYLDAEFTYENQP